MSYGQMSLTLQALSQYRPGTILLVEKNHISSRQKTILVFEFFIRKFEASSFEEVATEIENEVSEVNLKNAFVISNPNAQETIRTAHTGLSKLRVKFDAHHHKAAVEKLDRAIEAIEKVARENKIDLTPHAVQLGNTATGSSPSPNSLPSAKTPGLLKADPTLDEQRSASVTANLLGQTRRANSKTADAVMKQQQSAANSLAAEEKERAAQFQQQAKRQPVSPATSPTGSLAKTPAETTPLLIQPPRQPTAEVNSNLTKARAQKQQAYVQSMVQFKADLVSLGYSVGVIELAIHNLKTHPTFKEKWAPIFDKLEQGIAFSSDPKIEAQYRKDLMDTIEVYLSQNLSQLTTELSRRK